MSDRTESLLAELVELQRRQLANQEQALAIQRSAVDAQTGSIELQRLANNRQRIALRLVFALIVLALLALFPLTWLLRMLE
jgi:hypothetical protein